MHLRSDCAASGAPHQPCYRGRVTASAHDHDCDSCGRRPVGSRPAPTWPSRVPGSSRQVQLEPAVSAPRRECRSLARCAKAVKTGHPIARNLAGASEPPRIAGWSASSYRSVSTPLRRALSRAVLAADYWSTAGRPSRRFVDEARRESCRRTRRSCRPVAMQVHEACRGGRCSRRWLLLPLFLLAAWYLTPFALQGPSQRDTAMQDLVFSTGERADRRHHLPAAEELRAALDGRDVATWSG